MPHTHHHGHSHAPIDIAATPSIAPTCPYTLRDLAPGDAGWIIHRHGTVIAQEFGWSMAFEGMCADILAQYIREYQPTTHKSWIAWQDATILGSLFLMREDAHTARLRLLYVEPHARGMGLATALLEQSIAWARGVHYQRVILFTTDSNVHARRIYEKLGFQRIAQQPFVLDAQTQQGETWERALT
jgi:GNAT superfamily N-acetyltransferase